MDDNRLKEHIARVSVLSGEDLSLLLTCVTDHKLKRGEKVLKEGEICRSFYLVDEGYLRTYYNKDGVTINLNFSFEGEYACKMLATAFMENIELAKFIRILAIRLLLVSEEHSTCLKYIHPPNAIGILKKITPNYYNGSPYLRSLLI